MKLFNFLLKNIFFVFLICGLFLVSGAFCHQPRLITQNFVIVEKPEISKAYYGKVTGRTVFVVESKDPFLLYLNLLLPGSKPLEKEIKIELFSGSQKVPFLVFEGRSANWVKYFEPYGFDLYWKGPEYLNKVLPGKYTIVVSSPVPQKSYVLAIGQLESFDFAEIRNALHLVPIIKRTIFNTLPITFLFSIFGFSYVLACFILSGFLYFLLNLFMGKNFKVFQLGRLVLSLFGLVLLIFNLLIYWNPVIFVLSGIFLCISILKR